MKRRTSSRRARLALGVVGIAALALAVAPALASTQAAAGSFREGPATILEERHEGNTTIYRLTRDARITGTYKGIGHAEQTAIFQADGSFTFHQTIEFTGKVCGESVTLTFRVQGTGDAVENTLSGTYSVIGPTDVGRGHGTIEGVPDVGGTYEGEVRC